VPEHENDLDERLERIEGKLDKLGERERPVTASGAAARIRKYHADKLAREAAGDDGD
jgi:hypothetical protein